MVSGLWVAAVMSPVDSVVVDLTTVVEVVTNVHQASTHTQPVSVRTHVCLSSVCHTSRPELMPTMRGDKLLTIDSLTGVEPDDLIG